MAPDLLTQSCIHWLQTRVTTKYSIKPVTLREKKTAAAAAAATPPKPPRGSLVLKTYDPVSGVALKYRTTKAAEVSRLVNSLGRLGRSMAALPEEKDAGILPDAPALVAAPAEAVTAAVKVVAAAVVKPASTKGEGSSEAGKTTGQQPASQQPQQAGGSGGGGGGGKKKKKGKK
jgi:hypothetical protein